MVLLFSWYQVQQEDAINCGSSARTAGIMCANEDQIRRQGRWTNTTINGAYFTSLPRKTMRLMAGFPTNGRSFYFARAALTHLPASARSCSRRSTNGMTDKELDNNNPIQPTVAANAFVQMIMMLRKKTRCL
ncbi:hypothetical protein [Absidia glauca]|uniref:Ndc10 domain-containing protein n=1 Tax=Absidia glauca TaxID=4829 RepID=A0A168MXK3_ABSGL|nr:hypothetical protein [Absidia glauca]